MQTKDRVIEHEWWYTTPFLRAIKQSDIERIEILGVMLHKPNDTVSRVDSEEKFWEQVEQTAVFMRLFDDPLVLSEGPA